MLSTQGRMRLLIFGDVVGKPGRSAVKELLPELKTRYSPDLTIANVENLAHGKGITEKTLRELHEAGVDWCMSGDHILEKESAPLLADPNNQVLRPENFPTGTPGRGHALVETPKGSILLVNLIGQAFFREGETYSNPFQMIERILERRRIRTNMTIVDFHAEATSEKVAMGLFLDGRVSVVFGTHTHVPTADLRILPRGTAYRTDLGMTGLRDESLGVGKDIVIANFLHPETSKPFRWLDDGPRQLHATFVEIDGRTGKVFRVEVIDQDLEPL